MVTLEVWRDKICHPADPPAAAFKAIEGRCSEERSMFMTELMIESEVSAAARGVVQPPKGTGAVGTTGTALPPPAAVVKELLPLNGKLGLE